MSNYVIYDIETGRINRCLSCPPDMIDIQLQDGENYIINDVIDDGLHFVSNRQVIERPMFTAYLDGLTIKDVPFNTDVTIEGVRYVADGTDIELSFTLPGSYVIGLSLFPYVDHELQVTI